MTKNNILTLHPEKGKSGVNISRVKYEVVREAILDSLRNNREMTFKNLTDEIDAQLKSSFEGSVPWYVITVKLDLEARGMIERIPGSSPQRLRLVE